MREHARSELARLTRATTRVALGLAVALPAGVIVLALGGPVGVVTILLGVGVFLSGIFFVASYRYVVAERGVERGPYLPVYAIGWCRPPDGCNYALFDGAAREAPAWVVRLPLRRPMASGAAWLCGSSAQSWIGAVALVAESGELLGAGRIVSDKKAAARWARRATMPGPLVQKPPDGWFPPGSH